MQISQPNNIHRDSSKKCHWISLTVNIVQCHEVSSAIPHYWKRTHNNSITAKTHQLQVLYFIWYTFMPKADIKNKTEFQHSQDYLLLKSICCNLSQRQKCLICFRWDNKWVLLLYRFLQCRVNNRRYIYAGTLITSIYFPNICIHMKISMRHFFI